MSPAALIFRSLYFIFRGRSKGRCRQQPSRSVQAVPAGAAAQSSAAPCPLCRTDLAPARGWARPPQGSCSGPKVWLCHGRPGAVRTGDVFARSLLRPAAPLLSRRRTVMINFLIGGSPWSCCTAKVSQCQCESEIWHSEVMRSGAGELWSCFLLCCSIQMIFYS